MKKRGSRFYIKGLSIFLGFFFLLELVLQLTSVIYREPQSFENFAVFIDQVPSIIAAAESGDEPVYFVGDSTVFGIGSSDPAAFSLPSQIENLLKKAGKKLHCVNLGYPGTCTEEHLRVLSLLPDGARVFYRGGTSDKWNFGESGFRLSFGGRSMEIRSLKMLSLLYFRLFPAWRWQLRGERVRRKLKEILKQKKLQLTVVDYTEPNQHFFYFPLESLPRVPVFSCLKAGGFLTDEGYFDLPYRGIDGGHPNDLGYYLESLCVFNYICRQHLFGLTPLNEQEINTSGFIGAAAERYVGFLDNLRSLEPDDSFYKQLARIRQLVAEAWSMADTLHYSQPDNDRFRQEKERLERLSLLLFHDVRVGQALLRVQPDREKIALYYAVMAATIEPDSGLWVHINAVIENSGFALEKPSVSLLRGLGFYPLGSCRRFQRESAYPAELLSIRSDWEYFFSIPYDVFTEMVIPVCD